MSIWKLTVTNSALWCRMLTVGKGYTCQGTGVYGISMQFPLSVAVNLKLLLKKNKVISLSIYIYTCTHYLSENIWDISHDLGLDREDVSPNQQTIEEENWTCITFCTSKNTIKLKEKVSYKSGEKFANHISDEVLLCRIYKELKKLNLLRRQRTHLENGKRLEYL